MSQCGSFFGDDRLSDPFHKGPIIILPRQPPNEEKTQAVPGSAPAPQDTIPAEPDLTSVMKDLYPHLRGSVVEWALRQSVIQRCHRDQTLERTWRTLTQGEPYHPDPELMPLLDPANVPHQPYPRECQPTAQGTVLSGDDKNPSTAGESSDQLSVDGPSNDSILSNQAATLASAYIARTLYDTNPCEEAPRTSSTHVPKIDLVKPRKRSVEYYLQNYMAGDAIIFRKDESSPWMAGRYLAVESGGGKDGTRTRISVELIHRTGLEVVSPGNIHHIPDDNTTKITPYDKGKARSMMLFSFGEKNPPWPGTFLFAAIPIDVETRSGKEKLYLPWQPVVCLSGILPGFRFHVRVISGRHKGLEYDVANVKPYMRHPGSFRSDRNLGKSSISSIHRAYAYSKHGDDNFWE